MRSAGEERLATALEAKLKPPWRIYRNVAWLEKFAAAFQALASTTPDASDQRTIIPPVEAPELVRS